MSDLLRYDDLTRLLETFASGFIACRHPDSIPPCEHFSLLFDSLPLPILFLGPDDMIRACNPALAQLFGWGPKEMIGRHAAGLYAGDPMAGDDDHALPGNPVTCRRMDGESFRAERTAIPLHSDDGRSHGRLLIFRATRQDNQHEEIQRQLRLDVAARSAMLARANERLEQEMARRRRLEEAIRAIEQATTCSAEEEFFRNLVRQLALVLGVKYVLVAELTADGRRIRTLAVCAETVLVANTEYELAGTPCESVVRKKKKSCHFDKVRKRFPEDTMLVEMKAECYLGTPLRGASCGKPFGLLAVLDTKPMDDLPLAQSVLEIFSNRAATELERLRIWREKEELVLRLRRSQKIEAIGTLAGGIAHDFNNLLQVIQGHTELALLHAQGERLVGSLAKIRNASSRAADLVRQILVFSRHEEVDRTPLLPAALVMDLLPMIRETLPMGIELEQEIDTDCRPVLANATQLHQVVLNLCANAVDAIRACGGRLTVTVEEVQVGAKLALRSGTLAVGPHVRLAVADDGPGMDADTLERIFEPYFTTKETGRGTGLGLAIVHGIVEGHGGGLLATSKPGKGTLFEIYLPVLEGEVVIPAAGSDDGCPAEVRCRLLLVDDEEAIVQLLARILEARGCDVAAFTDSTDALKVFRQEPGRFDAAILDQMMPGLTGLDLAREMLAIRPELPVILVTGDGQLVTDKKVEETGISRLLLKPVPLKALIEVIKEVTESGPAGAEN